MRILNLFHLNRNTVNPLLSPLSYPLPSPLIPEKDRLIEFTNNDCNTSCGLIPVQSWAGSSDLFLLIFGCMTSNFMCLNFCTLHSSTLWGDDTIIFAKLKRLTLVSNKPSSINPPPPRQQNVLEINTQGLNRELIVCVSLTTKRTSTGKNNQAWIH